MKKSFILLVLLLMTSFTYAQIENSASDIVDYREKDGKIIITAMVNGKLGDFVLDLSGHCSIMESETAKFGIDTSRKAEFGYTDFVGRNYTPVSSTLLSNISLGNVVSALDANFFIIKDEPYLKELGAIGTIDGAILRNTVFTIDTNRKKITFTVPFRPPYMKLDRRTTTDVTAGTMITFKVLLDNLECNVVLDTWNSQMISMTPSDYATFGRGKTRANDGVMSIGFNKNIKAENQFKITDLSFVKERIKNVTVVENKSLKQSSVGLELLKNGIISVDISKGKIYFQPHNLVAIDDSKMSPKEVVIENGKLNPITAKYFKDHILDYTKGGKFISKAAKIIVIDFWATWCGPCMKLLPQMEKMAEKYKDRVIFCKVNADKEKELCNVFSIVGLPTLLFIAPGGEPISKMGANPEKVEEIIEELLKK